MNLLRRIEIECNKISKLITDYTKDGTIISTLSIMDDAIFRGEKEEILYHLKDIDNWYQRKKGAIRTNEHVFNYDEHEIAIAKIKELIADLENTDTEIGSVKSDEIITEDIIFISHARSDKSIADVFVSEIRKLKVDVDYTSIGATNPLETGEDFIQGLLKRIQECRLVIAIVSPNFYDSIICQIEMGMAYALRKKIIPLIIVKEPDFDVMLRGVFDANTKADHIHSEEDMVSLVEKLRPSARAKEIAEIARNIVTAVPEWTQYNKRSKQVLAYQDNIFSEMEKQGFIKFDDLCFFKYITEEKIFRYLWGWQFESGVKEYKDWLAKHKDLFIQDVETAYKRIIKILEDFEVIEASQYTSYNNIKEFKMKVEFIQQTIPFYNSMELKHFINNF